MSLLLIIPWHLFSPFEIIERSDDPPTGLPRGIWCIFLTLAFFFCLFLAGTISVLIAHNIFERETHRDLFAITTIGAYILLPTVYTTHKRARASAAAKSI